MDSLRRFTPSASMVVAIVALIVALGGTSYAVSSLPRNSVGSKQFKKGAVNGRALAANAITSAKVKDSSLLAKDFKAGQLPAGPQGAQGPQGLQGPQGPAGPAGASATALWAVVNGTGAPIGTNVPIVRSSGVVGTTTTTHSFAGEYRVQFDRDVSSCAYIAAVGQVGNSGQGFGFATAQGTNIGGGSAAVFVQTFDETGAEVDRQFHLAVFC
jgi:hypothetical protein